MVSLASGPAASVSLLGGETTVSDVPAFMETPVEPEPAPEPVETPAADARRLVVRMLGGEEVELGVFDDRDDAVEAARELVGRFAQAESEGDWPEVGGRYLRPGAIASIDVLVRD